LACCKRVVDCLRDCRNGELGSVKGLIFDLDEIW
jgi:hypothetical protein